MSQEEKKAQSDESKVGVYICHCGGNISDHVDVKQLAANIEKLPGVTVAHTNMFMCSDPGQELIQKDIKDGKINRVVVASCAPSLHETTFRGAIQRAGMNPYLYEHANIREQVSWVHDGEKATHKATGLVAGAIAKSENLQSLEPIRVDAYQHATVIGGGIAGLRAALDIARRGLKVSILEKSPFLGGNTARLDRLVPTGQRAEDVIRQLVQAVMTHPNIDVRTCCQVVGYQGYVGQFKLETVERPPQDRSDLAGWERAATLKAAVGDYVPAAGFLARDIPENNETGTLDTGAIIMATGFKSYVPRQGQYGYLQHNAVITLPELIRLMAEQPSSGPVLNVNGQFVRRVALIHCVGSRQIPGIDEPDENDHLNEYCSRTCCSATLQAAVDIRKRFPETHVFEFYRDIRTYGRGQEDVYEEASRQQVTFLRFEPDAPPVVEKTNGQDYPLRITVKDTLTFGEELEVPIDLVVLSTGMEPRPIKDLVEMMKLPVGADAFLQEVHPKLRPVELANAGILLAGTCQAPMDVGEACAAAQAAAAKAATLLAKGYVELDPFVAQVDSDRCQGTGACVAACPQQGAIAMVAQDIEGQSAMKAVVTPALCTGCGICVAECPHNAIDVKGWTLSQYEAMVDAIVAN